jgi:hypothetical protein
MESSYSAAAMMRQRRRAVRSVGSRYRVTVEIPRPFDGPDRGLDVDVLVDADDHTFLDLGHGRKEDAAIVLEHLADILGRRIELANARDRLRIVDPGIDAGLAARQAAAVVLVEPVPKIVIPVSRLTH